MDRHRYKKYGQRCTPEQRKKWRRNRWNNSDYVIKIRKQSNERSKVIKKFLAEYKIKLGCKDCGYNKHHVALDFDHVIGKKKINICLAKSISQAKREIEKCEVVCSNCHRIRTYMRRSE
jgi:hypothetical protein